MKSAFVVLPSRKSILWQKKKIEQARGSNERRRMLKGVGQRHVTKDVAAERERVLAAWLAARDKG